MAKEICISSTPHETRLAILEDDQLAEIYYERENEYTLAGSIYNGRVTRVLPGMQSAFVDVGLERDAFLYVTDFMELEDPEETDELEKAAATGANQPPREVRHSNGQEKSGGRQEERPAPPSQKPIQKQETRQDRPPRDRRPVEDAAPMFTAATPSASESLFISEKGDDDQKDSGELGAKRWRGRRHRRGGRGSAGTPERREESENSTASYPETSAETEVATAIQASAQTSEAPPLSAGRREGTRFPASTSSQRWETAGQASVPASAPRAAQVPVPFVLPGESLSKYGGTPVEGTPKAAQEAAPPPIPVSTYKPSTLIETPIEWDGSGLMPGESLSRHRTAQTEPEREVEPRDSGDAADAIEEEAFVSEMMKAPAEYNSGPATETMPEALALAASGDRQFEEETLEDEMFDETTESAPELSAADAGPEEKASAEPEEFEVETVIEQPSADEPLAAPMTRQDETVVDPGTAESTDSEPSGSEAPAPDSKEREPDASASHHVDPAPHPGFRLFGFGGKKKTEEEEAAEKPRPASVAAVSAYAPGTGHIEEEVLDEEEFDAPRHHRHKADEHDLDDFEEETLPTQMRTGDLGELLQEAHLDHRIQLKFDEKNGEDEAFDDEEGEEEPSSDGQTATSGTQGQQRHDRNARGRRGRGGPVAPQQANRRGPSRRSAQTSDLPIISDLLKPGQEILVQIAKEPIAKKGARITSHIALPGRFLVFMPTVTHIGVSRKIAADEERQRLKRILVHERGEASGGFIVRTAAEGASEEDLRADLRFLLNLWSEIKQRSDTSKSPALIYHDLSLIERILRDQVSSNFSNIWVDSEADYERIVRFLNRFSPNLVRRVKLYTKETPLFEHFGIQDEISKALRSKVWLKSGGSIVINQTEALVAIDINTGKYVGKSARLEDTILKTNLDAVPEIVRQIRLRDLGGIIVIDFIDMDERKNRFKVMAALEEALKSDRAPTKVLQFNDFGLVAITRKRVKQSLERTLSVPCPVCQATGMVKSPTTVCNEIYTELRKMKKHFEGADVLLRVNPETVKVLKSNNASWLTELEELVGKNILVKSDATIHPEQFDIQG
jgi:ribonuclease E